MFLHSFLYISFLSFASLLFQCYTLECRNAQVISKRFMLLKVDSYSRNYFVFSTLLLIAVISYVYFYFQFNIFLLHFIFHALHQFSSSLHFTLYLVGKPCLGPEYKTSLRSPITHVLVFTIPFHRAFFFPPHIFVYSACAGNTCLQTTPRHNTKDSNIQV